MNTDSIFPALKSLNLSYWAIQALLMAITSGLIPRLRITSIFGPILAVIAISLVNATVWNAAMFFEIPDHLSSQVAVLLLANGAIFWVIVKILPGIEVDGILPAIVAPVLYTVLSLGVAQFHDKIPWQKMWNFSLEHVQQVREYIAKDPEAAPRHERK
jgi:uncharacterized membrane protein YvlD (DUF360 family)